jgi:GT2 family glycosyltransferase
LIHRTFWDRLGGFDPAFFMYGEDADLCARAWADGGRCVICPDATLIHHGGASEPVRADKLVRLFSAKAMLFRKHWTPAKAVVGTMALDAWAATRTVACAAFGTVRPASRRSMKVWASVFARRGEWRPGWSDPVATPPTPLERAHT